MHLLASISNPFWSTYLYNFADNPFSPALPDQATSLKCLKAEQSYVHHQKIEFGEEMNSRKGIKYSMKLNLSLTLFEKKILYQLYQIVPKREGTTKIRNGTYIKFGQFLEIFLGSIVITITLSIPTARHHNHVKGRVFICFRSFES